MAKSIKEVFELTVEVKNNLADEGKATEYLSELAKAYEEIEKENKELVSKHEQITIDNESLRKANMKLFMEQGKDYKDIVKEEQKKNEDIKPKTITHDDIFKTKN